MIYLIYFPLDNKLKNFWKIDNMIIKDLFSSVRRFIKS